MKSRLFITLLLPSSCILPSLLTCTVFDLPSTHPPCILDTLALFSTKMAPFKVTHDDCIAKSIDFLSCLHSKHLTLFIPLLSVTILSALRAPIFVPILPLLFPVCSAGLPKHSRKFVNNQGLQGCPHRFWMGRSEGGSGVCIWTSSPGDSSCWGRLGNCFHSWCFLRSGSSSAPDTVSVPKAPSPVIYRCSSFLWGGGSADISCVNPRR